MTSVVDVSRLTDSDLAVKLKEHGVSVGPITSTTRSLFEKKLDRLINGHNPEIEEVNAKDVSSKNENLVVIEKVSTTPQIYFAVQVPHDVRSQEENYIMTDRKEALQLVKKHTGSRFKIFQCKDLAEQYIDQARDVIPASPKTEISAKNTVKPAEGSAFRGPKPPELVAFRRMLEQGNTEGAKNTVWENPRYLISSGDTPTILQENFRYNALHVCSAKNQAGSAEVVLNLLKDESLFQLMYPDDSPTTRLGRMTFITDLYLNTPDKGVNETPLHFACKFGHVEVVQVLVMQKVLDKERVNKFGEKPRDIVCNRMRNGSGTAKKDIYSLLSEQCFVPLIRAVDDTEPPQVTGPVSPEHVMKTLDADKYGSPKEAPHTIRAMAGPMSPVQAEKFRKKWTTPPSPTIKDRIKYTSIRRGDPTKGLERIGRDLAHMLRIPWSEYWEFLDTFADLSTLEGIDLLERYLREKGNEISQERHLNEELDSLGSLLKSLDLESHAAKENKKEGRGEKVIKKSLFHSEDSNCVREDVVVQNIKQVRNPFMPKSFLNMDASDAENSFILHGANDSQKSEVTIRDGNCNDKMLSTNFPNSGNTEEDDLLSAISVKEQGESGDISEQFVSSTKCGNCDHTDNAFMLKKQLNCIKPTGNNISSHSDDMSENVSERTPVGSDTNETNSESSTVFNTNNATVDVMEAVRDDGTASSSRVNKEDSNSVDGYESDTDSVESYHTATDSSDGEDVFEDSFDSTDGATHNSSACVAFVYGQEPSKADVDVLRAIEYALVSPVNHPCVFNWRNAVTCYSDKSRTKWSCNTPGRRLSQSTPRKQTFTPRSRSLGGTPSMFGSPLSLGGEGLVSFSVSESSDSSFTEEDDTMKKIRANLIPNFLSESNA